MVQAEVEWTEEALEHLRSIRAYLSTFNPSAADRIARRLRHAGESLGEFPDRGRPAAGGTRELATVPPYILRYEVSDGKVFILSIRHGRQRPPED